jgi:adenylate cyclase
MSVVLLIDDDDSSRELLAKLLRSEGFETRAARTASEALTELAQAPPDLLLLDITMPEMDGLSFLESIQREPTWAAVPVIMFSALDGRPVIDRAEQLGAKAYCVKGRDSFPEVLAQVRQHIHA